ncbi:hypothetical protein STIAU_7012 [Stigmatella aurantiaca DW4/3-1]|uniref:Uncharacterized protein n=1 Tax=Stigmatella aurantiaca (strain DW4/3-1) TaxID=378806 RepID=Q08SV7_STIAD|nr:hypothetical protein STIAU_7012 [Stigmatella aurantiaca DW4/3-1]
MANLAERFWVPGIQAVGARQGREGGLAIAGGKEADCPEAVRLGVIGIELHRAAGRLHRFGELPRLEERQGEPLVRLGAVGVVPAPPLELLEALVRAAQREQGPAERIPGFAMEAIALHRLREGLEGHVRQPARQQEPALGAGGLIVARILHGLLELGLRLVQRALTPVHPAERHPEVRPGLLHAVDGLLQDLARLIAVALHGVRQGQIADGLERVAVVHPRLLQLGAGALPVLLPDVGRRAHQGHLAAFPVQPREHLFHPVPVQQRAPQPFPGVLAPGLELEGGLIRLLGLLELPRRAARIAEGEVEVERERPLHPLGQQGQRLVVSPQLRQQPALDELLPRAQGIHQILALAERLHVRQRQAQILVERQLALRHADARQGMLRRELPGIRVHVEGLLRVVEVLVVAAQRHQRADALDGLLEALQGLLGLLHFQEQAARERIHLDRTLHAGVEQRAAGGLPPLLIGHQHIRGQAEPLMLGAHPWMLQRRERLLPVLGHGAVVREEKGMRIGRQRPDLAVAVVHLARTVEQRERLFQGGARVEGDDPLGAPQHLRERPASLLRAMGDVDPREHGQHHRADAPRDELHPVAGEERGVRGRLGELLAQFLLVGGGAGRGIHIGGADRAGGRGGPRLRGIRNVLQQRALGGGRGPLPGRRRAPGRVRDTRRGGHRGQLVGGRQISKQSPSRRRGRSLPGVLCGPPCLRRGERRLLLRRRLLFGGKLVLRLRRIKLGRDPL